MDPHLENNNPSDRLIWSTNIQLIDMVRSEFQISTNVGLEISQTCGERVAESITALLKYSNKVHQLDDDLVGKEFHENTIWVI